MIFLRALNNFLMRLPRWSDALILIFFTVLITLHPYYLNDRINVFELGLYLPGINAIHHGLVPFRDFVHLRGPLELYAPAWLMGLFGMRMDVLCAYFFFGNVLCLILIVLIARELIHSRYMLYLMVPSIIARTYPRVVFMIWGGMRYALGLMAMFCLIRFLKNKQPWWIAATGFVSALAALVSVEIGVYTVAAVIVCLGVACGSRLIPARECRRSFIYFVAAGVLGMSPWIIYSLAQHAFVPYLDATWTVITRLHMVINEHLVSIYPSNFPEALAAMINPVSVNFKQMTPAYLYLFLAGYLIWRWRKRAFGSRELALLSLGVYGFIMYNTGFRGLWAAQFEMALMPEKILYFFLVEAAVLWLWTKREIGPGLRNTLIGFVVAGLFISSWAYAISRYNHRFWAYQYFSSTLTGKGKNSLKYRDKKETYAPLTIERAKGIWVPVDQAKDLSQLDIFIRTHTRPDDTIVMFPELGMYNFLFDRPFLGRFPITTFTWFNDRWFDEYLGLLKSAKAKYIIVQKRMPNDWYVVYMWSSSTKSKYQQMLEVIHRFYAPVAQTETTVTYERK